MWSACRKSSRWTRPFRARHFEALGYHVETHGQKGFNGVAILSKLPLEDVVRGLPGDDSRRTGPLDRGDGDGPPRRAGLRALSAERQPRAGAEIRLQTRPGWRGCEARVRALLETEEPLVFCGDYNVIPQAEDAAQAARLADGCALSAAKPRAPFGALSNLGLTDAFRARNPRPGQYTFWDFQRGAWERNNGIRIDHLLLSPQAADLLPDCQIDKAVRGRRQTVGPCAGLDRSGRLTCAIPTPSTAAPWPTPARARP